MCSRIATQFFWQVNVVKLVAGVKNPRKELHTVIMRSNASSFGACARCSNARLSALSGDAFDDEESPFNSRNAMSRSLRAGLYTTTGAGPATAELVWACDTGACAWRWIIVLNHTYAVVESEKSGKGEKGSFRNSGKANTGTGTVIQSCGCMQNITWIDWWLMHYRNYGIKWISANAQDTDAQITYLRQHHRVNLLQDSIERLRYTGNIVWCVRSNCFTGL
jgi:hypothetical protein